MPIYEYRCPHCQSVMEVSKKMSEKAPEECPKCHKKGLERLYSASVGIQFKGTGFYCTDYKDNPKSSCSCGNDCSCK